MREERLKSLYSLNPLRIKLSSGGESDPNEEQGVATLNKAKTKLPKKYKVLIHNDDYNTSRIIFARLYQKHKYKCV